MEKLSTLIREGAKLRPQTYGKSFSLDKVGEKHIICSCALGAAYETLTGRANPMLNHLEVRDLVLLKCGINPSEPNIVINPINHSPEPLTWVVLGLNDDEHWSREQIADYLESQGY